MKDIVVVSALVLAFATLVTAHVALVARLVLHERPRWRGLLALVVPPLAVLWAFRAGWRKTATVWLLAVVVWVVAWIAAHTLAGPQTANKAGSGAPLPPESGHISLASRLPAA